MTTKKDICNNDTGSLPSTTPVSYPMNTSKKRKLGRTYATLSFNLKEENKVPNTTKATSYSENEELLPPLKKMKLAHTGNLEKGHLIRPVRIAPRKRHVYQGPMSLVIMKLAKELEQILNRLLLHSEMEVLNEYAKSTQIPMLSIVEGFIIFYYPMLDSEIDLERLAFYTVHLAVVKQGTSTIENPMDAQYPATMASGLMDTKDNEQCYWMTSMDAQANGHSTPCSELSIDMYSSSLSKDHSSYGTQTESTLPLTFTPDNGMIGQHENSSIPLLFEDSLWSSGGNNVEQNLHLSQDLMWTTPMKNYGNTSGIPLDQEVDILDLMDIWK